MGPLAWVSIVLQIATQAPPADSAQAHLRRAVLCRQNRDHPCAIAELRQALQIRPDLRDAQTSRPSWDPRTWSADQAARVLLVLALEADPARLARCLDQLCNTADVSELAAFCFPAISIARTLPGSRCALGSTPVPSVAGIWRSFTSTGAPRIAVRQPPVYRGVD